jgi:hypothetical protein
MAKSASLIRIPTSATVWVCPHSEPMKKWWRLSGRGPDAATDEIAAELDKRISARLTQTNPVNPAAEKSPVQTKLAPSAQSQSMDPPVVRPCHEDHLTECTDEQVLERLAPLVKNILAIQEEYSADTKHLDDIKGGKFDWLRELSGVGGDKDSKWLKGLEAARKKASDQFRDCCAQKALVYHKELLLRDHEGSDSAELYEWVQNLLRPEGSKEWKKARDDGAKVSSVYFDLRFYQIRLEYVVAVSHIPGHHS